MSCRRKRIIKPDKVKSEIFEYIEMFYIRIRQHSHFNQLSPMMFEQLQNIT